MANKGTSYVTELLPTAESKYALAKANPDFREGYLVQAQRFGTCDNLKQVETKFNLSDNYVSFLRSVGVIQ